jgi:hypothetical protein
MREFRSLADRLADQAKAREKLARRAREMANKRVLPKTQEQDVKVAPPCIEVLSTATRPWARVRAGSAELGYYARATNELLSMQPWTAGLVSTLLSAAADGSTTLCLVWPAKMVSLPLLHSLANIERIFARDLRGLRTLLYPATHACRAPLHAVLADKTQLSNFYRTLWERQPNGSIAEVTNTSSPALLAALGAINDVRNYHPEVPNPSLAELIPIFVFDPVKQVWSTTVVNPLERTLSKVDRLANRQNLRLKINAEWAKPANAPGALMALHHSTKKKLWPVALAAGALKDEGRPEVLLFDATHAAIRTNHVSVKRIQDLLLAAHENGLSNAGSVIVTDDPRTFFVLRAQLKSLKLTFSTKEWAAESEDVLLSPQPAAIGWQPVVRSNSNFSVSIVDRDASQVALTFQRVLPSAGNEESGAHKALLQASMYVLRLSNLPAGYTDLTAASTEAGSSDYVSQQNAWTPAKQALIEALASGELNAVRTTVLRAIERAEQLIDDWNDATPMAARMLAEVKKIAVSGRRGIALVLPKTRYVLLAHRFLQRRLGSDWAAAEPRVEWHTLSSVAKTLTGDHKGKHFVFVGVNQDVLRFLMTHPDVPHGTAVLVAYRQADSTRTTLNSMKQLEAFKPYRGRIGLLAQELDRRLAEVPNPVAIDRLREMPMTFKFDDRDHAAQGGDQSYYRFELEGGGIAYASGWIYRHVPDEDPPFRRTPASTVQSGDFIFRMSDELTANLESSLQLNSEGTSSIVDPVRMLLKLYHDDVQTRCELMFGSTKRSTLAREIHAKMIEVDADAMNCRQGRVYYWLALGRHGDTRPHAAKDAKYFRTFCKSLGITDEAAEQHWAFIRNARRLNQYLGRELAARYAEILLRPESALIYRKVPEEAIKRLQQDALRCVYRVERVVPPADRATKNKREKTSACSQ